MKPDGIKVLLVTDVGNWAWAHKAAAIQKYLNDEFRKITVVTAKQFHKGLMAKYHSVHFFGWLDRRKIAGKYKGMTAGVSSHNFEYLHPEKAKVYMKKFGALTATSKLIYDKLKEKGLNSNVYYCPNGVDENRFYCGEKTRRRDKFVIGWSGQPSGKGFNRSSGLDAHGYHNILLPLVDSLKDEKDIEFDIIARTHNNAIPWDKMPDYYHNLDFFIHTGIATGTPNPLFEAQACGIPGMSTRVGAAPELFESGINGILVDRPTNKDEAKKTVEQMRANILELKSDDMRMDLMYARSRIEILYDWTWEKRARNWLPVFLNHKKVI